MASDNPSKSEQTDSGNTVQIVQEDKAEAETSVDRGATTASEIDDNAEHDPYYPPIVYLPEIVVNSGEDGEEEIFKRRAKLYR